LLAPAREALDGLGFLLLDRSPYAGQVGLTFVYAMARSTALASGIRRSSLLIWATVRV
jgi:hypothetical protein